MSCIVVSNQSVFGQGLPCAGDGLFLFAGWGNNEGNQQFPFL